MTAEEQARSKAAEGSCGSSPAWFVAGDALDVGRAQAASAVAHRDQGAPWQESNRQPAA